MEQPSFSGRSPPTLSARAKVRKLWQEGDLFHVTRRYPRKATAPRIDRLAAILRAGLVAPARCARGSVVSDLNLTVLHCEPAYDDFVFLHRFGPKSWLYTMSEPGRFAVFIDPRLAVLTPEEMGDAWPELCQDEVYVRGCVGRESFLGVAIHPADADTVLADLLKEFESLAIPIYDCTGNVIWPSETP